MNGPREASEGNIDGDGVERREGEGNAAEVCLTVLWRKTADEMHLSRPIQAHSEPLGSGSAAGFRRGAPAPTYEEGDLAQKITRLSSKNAFETCHRS